MFVAGLMTFALVVMRWVISKNSSGNLQRLPFSVIAAARRNFPL